MVVALTSSSKLCIKGPRCDLVHEGCTANMSVESLIASAKNIGLRENVEDVQRRGLTVNQVVCDVHVEQTGKLHSTTLVIFWKY